MRCKASTTSDDGNRAVAKLLAMTDEIRAFLKEHDAELKAKPE